MAAVVTTRAFWNDQAERSPRTRDLCAEGLERHLLLKHVKGPLVLELGCGAGVTARALAETRDCLDITAVDWSEGMIERARRGSGVGTADNPWHSTLTFAIHEFPGEWIKELDGTMDTVYTQRMLITLPTWAAQRAAIIAVARLLHPGGRAIFVENSQDGVDALNSWREHVGLPPVIPPHWDRYLRDTEMDAVAHECFAMQEILDYSATYYFVSRVIYARWAANAGHEPDYAHPLNQVATRVPPIPGLRGQGRAWILQR